MDFAGRIARLRERAEAAAIDLVYLTLGANLFYLSGIRRRFEHGTDHNAYGDWACGAFIDRKGGLTILAPRMGGGFFKSEAADKPWIRDVRLIQEAENPADVLAETLAGFGSLRRIALDDRAWAQHVLALRGIPLEAELTLASSLIAPMRAIKDDDELAAMRRASEMADLVFARTLPLLKVGVTEFEVIREVDLQFQLAGAEFTSFETGVTFKGSRGPDAGTTRPGQRRLQPGDSIMFDFGCVLDGYCSDFGRSAFAGEPPAEYRTVHATVLAAQGEAMKAMRAGRCTGAQANAVARQVIADAGYGAGFNHRLGHGIGVTVHEPPWLDVVETGVLQERMCFTVEPSIIFPDRLANRVEDVVLVTKEGGTSLNQASHDLVIVG
jgi:Xaa-Pro aminopeptidase